MRLTEVRGVKSDTIKAIIYVVRAVVLLVGYHKLIPVRYERGKLIYTHCHLAKPRE